MRLIVTYKGYGHIELLEDQKVLDGVLKGLSQKELFEKIMHEGYGGKIPALFHAEYKNGDSKIVKGDERKSLLDDPNVVEVMVIPPIAGG